MESRVSCDGKNITQISIPDRAWFETWDLVTGKQRSYLRTSHTTTSHTTTSYTTQGRRGRRVASPPIIEISRLFFTKLAEFSS